MADKITNLFETYIRTLLGEVETRFLTDDAQGAAILVLADALGQVAVALNAIAKTNGDIVDSLNDISTGIEQK